jgi:DMSO/TMAO reductase YedYZ molybdopterin-dependent catalytic subunit
MSYVESHQQTTSNSTHHPVLTSRREFLSRALLAGGGLVMVGSGCATNVAVSPGAPASASAADLIAPLGKDPSKMILHVASPLGLETRRAAFGTSVVTPYEMLYVRNNLPTPHASIMENPERWELAVEGVARPRVITLAELKNLGLETVAMVLQCSGNGRGFFEHRPGGSPWTVGAAACLIWSGVPVRTLVQALGNPVSNARFLTATGGEALPDGIDPKTVVVERSIPLQKGMEDALLAWEMNGQAVPLLHGGPLRLIVPGYSGINQIKYVRRLALTPEESDAAIMRTRYRMQPLGEPPHPSQPTVWEMSVKSWINRPTAAERLDAGRLLIHGVAFGGMQPLRRVEISSDGGQVWREASLVGPDLGKYAWRHFTAIVTVPAGTHILASRATDVNGNTQPAERLENEAGYGNNSWRDHAVSITVT